MSVKSNTCPLRMADGRVMTDYRPKCIINYELIEKVADNNLIKSSHETRMYLQNNASEIMKNDMDRAFNNLVPCTSCKLPVNNGTVLPEKHIVTCDAVSCNKTIFNSYGLGDGRKGDTSLIQEH